MRDGLADRLAEIAGVSVQELRAARGETFEAALLGHLPTGAARAEAILRHLGKEAKPEIVAALVETEIEWVGRLTRFYPDTRPTLLELRRRGYKLGLVSGVSRLWRDIPPFQELVRLFDARALSCEVQVGKPDPEIYLHACRALRVEPVECVYIGDGAGDELAGARRLGMTAIWIDQEIGYTREQPVRDYDQRITRLGELLELLPEKYD